MSKRLVLGLVASVLALSIPRDIEAQNLFETTVVERRKHFKSEIERARPCPMDDDEFWPHWATERGYENLFHGRLDDAANCYIKAGEMYRRSIAVPEGQCFVCEGYERVGAILRDISDNAVDIRSETFEESANRAVVSGNTKLIPRLYELTALGYSLELEGAWGRFGTSSGGYVLHRERVSWQEEYNKAGNFFERAAELSKNKKEKRRLLQQAKILNEVFLDTGYCSVRGAKDTSLGYPRCIEAKGNVDRLNAILKEKN